MKVYGGMEVYYTDLLPWAVDGSEWTAFTPQPIYLTPGKTSPSTHRMEDIVDVVDALEVTTVTEANHSSSVVQFVA